MGLPQYLMFDAPNIYDCLRISLTVPGGEQVFYDKTFCSMYQYLYLYFTLISA